MTKWAKDIDSKLDQMQRQIRYLTKEIKTLKQPGSSQEKNAKSGLAKEFDLEKVAQWMNLLNNPMIQEFISQLKSPGHTRKRKKRFRIFSRNRREM